MRIHEAGWRVGAQPSEIAIGMAVQAPRLLCMLALAEPVQS
jgi:hypothetical protein